MIGSAASADRRNAVVFTALTACLGCAAGVLVSATDSAGGRAGVVSTHGGSLPYARGARTICPTGSAVKSCGKPVLIAARDEMGLATPRDETLQEAEPQPAQHVHLLARERAKLTGKWFSQSASVPGWRSRVGEIVRLHRHRGGKIYADIVPKVEADARGVARGVAYRRAARHEAGRRRSNAAGTGDGTVAGNGRCCRAVCRSACRASSDCQPGRKSRLARGPGTRLRQPGAADQPLLELLARSIHRPRWLLRAAHGGDRSEQRSGAVASRLRAWALGGTLLAHSAWPTWLSWSSDSREAAQSGAAASPPPSWAKLIAAYCKCDRSGVAQAGTDFTAYQPWATMLEFLLLRCAGEPHAMFNRAASPEGLSHCLLCLWRPVALWRSTDAECVRALPRRPEMFSRHVPESLSTLPGLPARVQSLVAARREPWGEPGGRTGRWRRVRSVFTNACGSGPPTAQESATAVRGEPSWSALACLLEEQQFVQIVNYCVDSLNAVQHSMANEVDRLLPLIENHRYAAFVKGLRYDFRNDTATVVQLYGSMKIVEPRMNMASMLRTLWKIPDSTGYGMGEVAHLQAHRNFTFQGMLEFVEGYASTVGPPENALANMFIDEVHEVAPQSDKSVALHSLWAKSPTADQLKDWESQLKDNALALNTLAHLYWDAQDVEGAMRCAERSIAASPTSGAAVLLADIWMQRGDLAKWEQTLLDYLQTPDLGLEHGNALNMLAMGYAERGQWQKAKPYAEEFAQTWAWQGLFLGAAFAKGWPRGRSRNNGSGEPPKAIPRRMVSSGTSGVDANGRGDVEAAARLAQQHAAMFDRQTREMAIFEGAYHLLNGDERSALEAYRAALAFRPSFTCTFMVAQLARTAGDERLRSEVITAMQKARIEAPRRRSPEDAKTDAAGSAVLQLMKSGDDSTARLEKLEKLLSEIDATACDALSYFVGKELDALGKKDEAEKYWRRSLTIARYDTATATLAGFELAKRHGTSRPDDDVLDEDDRWPKQ